MLDDGTYDVFVVDAEEVPAAPGQPATLRLDLTILAGPHKGEVVTTQAVGLRIDELDALGLPGTLTVVDGRPSVTIDR
jgi:hypothetical protein